MVFKKVDTYSKYHSLHMSGFGSAGNIYFLSIFVKHVGPYICCIFGFRGHHKLHSACKAFTHFPFAFLSWLNKVLAAVSFCPIGRSSVGNHCFRINLYTIRFLRCFFGGREDI